MWMQKTLATLQPCKLCSSCTFANLETHIVDNRYSFLRGLGLAVGVSLAGTILQNRLHYWLIVEQLPPHIAEDIIGYIMILNTLPESEYTAAVRLAIARSHRNLCEASLGYTALGLLLMLKLRKGDMNKALASKQRIEKKEETDEVILTDITDSKA